MALKSFLFHKLKGKFSGTLCSSDGFEIAKGLNFPAGIWANCEMALELNVQLCPEFEAGFAFEMHGPGCAAGCREGFALDFRLCLCLQ